jgi:D-glycero-D-manno-heptose 1,7-bisphosphate phosphatase
LVQYAAVALGDAHSFVQQPVPGKRTLKVWDHAAGVAVVREAGGAVFDFDGDDVRLGDAGPVFHPAGSALVACCAAAAPALRALLPRACASAAKGIRLVLLDRDGVLNEDVGPPGVLSPNELRLLPGAAAAVAAMAGYTIALVTNQSCVDKGLLTVQQMCLIQERLERQLAAEGAVLHAAFACFERADGASPRRKPGPNMLLEACARFGVPPSAAAMVGDSAADMLAAARAGVPRRLLICTGWHGQQFGQAATAAGLRLPARLETNDGPFGALLPREALPLSLHKDLASAVQEILAHSSLPL